MEEEGKAKMIRSKSLAILGTILASLFIGESAFAGACQVLSTSWNQKLYCGLQSRGYGRGSTSGIVKKLKAVSTGVPGPYSDVGAVAVNSSGTLLTACKVVDTEEDILLPDYPEGIPAEISGGQCQQGVKFWVQVGY